MESESKDGTGDGGKGSWSGEWGTREGGEDAEEIEVEDGNGEAIDLLQRLEGEREAGLREGLCSRPLNMTFLAQCIYEFV